MRFGVLGYGSIGKRHYQNIMSLGHNVVWYDPDSYGPKIRDDVINWGEAVIICSPSKNHAHDMMDAVRAGKHVLCEKPFGYDCPKLLEGFMWATRHKPKKDLIIATGFNLRFHACVKKVKELLPEIGPLKAAMFTVRQKTEKPPYLMDGIIRNWLSHEFDLAHYLLGPGSVVSCTADDTSEAHVVMEFAGVKNKVHFEADYYTDPEQRYFWIEGKDGALYVDLVKRNVFMRTKEGRHVQVLAAMDNWDGNYVDEMQSFIKSIELGVHQDPLATGEDGVRALYTVMDARQKAGI